jgi:2-keto-3-deoxy-L-rhamnonate aldolase RhmA
LIKFNPVKKLYREGKPAFGTWLTLCPHPRAVKIMAAAGFDFLLLEMEHTDFTLREIGTLSMLARECGITPIVRPPGVSKPHDLTRALDAGAQGLLLPAIEDAEQMAAILKAVRYHPLGNRPMNLRGPHTDYAALPPNEIVAHLNSETLIVVMIETRNAIENLPEILKVDGIDAIMVGPRRPVAGSRHSGRPAEPDDVRGLRGDLRPLPRGRHALRAQRAVARDGEALARHGAQWIPYQNDAAMVLNTARAAVPQLMSLAGRA